MSPDDQPGSHALDLNGWLKNLADRFRRAWDSDQRQTVESVVASVPHDRRDAVLRSLLLIEVQYRQATESPALLPELLERFPLYPAIVTEVWQLFVSTVSFADRPADPRQSSSEFRSTRASEETRVPESDTDTDARSSASASGKLRIPRSLGRYKILRRIGQGGMGTVFLAHDESLGRDVALKILRSDIRRNTEMQERFRREARAVAHLQHAGICPVYDISEFQGIQFICMAYVEGLSLTHATVGDALLSEQRVAEIILQLAEALAVAHERGVVHRDLKPANIMLKDDGTPVILDFGLAVRCDESGGVRLTQAGTALGSPRYVSPEQLDNRPGEVGPASDVYSLGVVMFELLTGRLPFEGTVKAVLGQIISKAPERPSTYRKQLNVRLERLCLQMLEKDPSRRPAGMSEVAARLREYLSKFHSRDTVSREGEQEESPGQNVVGRAEQRKTHIEALVKNGDYSEAEKLLVRLSRETSGELSQLATWAAAELTRVRRTRQKVRAGRQEIYTTAVRLMKGHDYKQAAKLLEEYPFEIRTPEMQTLLEEAERLGNEVDLLRRHIRSARNRGDNTVLLRMLKDLLQLQPGDRRAQRLLAQLTKKTIFHRAISTVRNVIFPAAVRRGKKKSSSGEAMLVAQLVVRAVLCVVLFAAMHTGYTELRIRKAYDESLAVVQSMMDVVPQHRPAFAEVCGMLSENGAIATDVSEGKQYRWPSRFNDYTITLIADGSVLDGFHTDAYASGEYQQSLPSAAGTKTDRDTPGNEEKEAELHPGPLPENPETDSAAEPAEDTSADSAWLISTNWRYLTDGSDPRVISFQSDGSIVGGPSAGTWALFGKTLRIYWAPESASGRVRVDRVTFDVAAGTFTGTNDAGVSVTGYRVSATDSPSGRSGSQTTSQNVDSRPSQTPSHTERSRSSENSAPTVAPAPVQKVLLPPGRDKPRAWRYVSNEPVGDWWEEKYNDLSWRSGAAGFGSQTRSWVRTVWSSDYLWARTSFEIDAVPVAADWVIFHDNETLIYINGKPVGRFFGWTTSHVVRPLSADALGALKKGRNVIAVYCRNRKPGGGNPGFLDVGIVAR